MCVGLILIEQFVEVNRRSGVTWRTGSVWKFFMKMRSKGARAVVGSLRNPFAPVKTPEFASTIRADTWAWVVWRLFFTGVEVSL